MELTEQGAATTYAKAWNLLEYSEFIKLLDSNAHYASQTVFAELENKAAISDYLVGKMTTVKNTGSKVYAELGLATGAGIQRHCVLMAQGNKEEVIALILFQTENNKISRYDMCLPHLYSVERTNVYPT